MRNTSRNGKRGFTLVELAIVLSVAGLMFVGLWRLLAGGNQQVRDQASASQQEQLISATKAYLASPQGQSWIETLAANGTGNLALPPNGTACNLLGTTAQQFTCFLPAGFNALTNNSYGQAYSIQALRDSTAGATTPNSYSFMVITTGGDAIPDTSGGRISAFIGGDGGFIYSTNVCGAVPQWACGAYGGWSVNVTLAGPNGYGFAGPATGHIASRTFTTPSSSNSGPWLARQILDAATKYTWNTMSTDLYMGGTSTVTGATASNIYLYPPAGSAAIGAATPGSINLAAPTGGVAGAINMNGGTINIQGGTITGDGNSASSITIASPAGTLIPQISIASGCAQTSPGNPVGCPYSLLVTGDVSVSNLLNANALYASTFIYGTVLPPSDMRLKKDIRPLSDPLADIMRLKPVSYTLKANGMQSFGVTAQDLEKVYPQLVHDTGREGMKGVEYIGLIGPLIGAVQELKQENDALRQKLHEQDMREKALETQIKRDGP